MNTATPNQTMQRAAPGHRSTVDVFAIHHLAGSYAFPDSRPLIWWLGEP